MTSLIIQQVIGGGISVVSAIVIILILRKYDSQRVDSIEQTMIKSIETATSSIKELNNNFIKLFTKQEVQQKELEFGDQKFLEFGQRLDRVDKRLDHIEKLLRRDNV